MRLVTDPTHGIMSRSHGRTLGDYVLGACLVGMFLLIRGSPLLHAEAYVGWSLPVILAAWVGGFGPGLAATALAALVANALETTATPLVVRTESTAVLFATGAIISTLLARRALAAHEMADRTTELARLKRHLLSALITCDHMGQIADVNPSSMRLFGYTAAELAGQPLTKLIQLDGCPPGEVARYLTTMADSPAGRGLRVHGRLRDGEDVVCRVSVFRHSWHGASLVTLVVWRASLADQFESELVGRGPL